MTGQAMARRNGVTADVGPAPGSAWQPPRPGVPRPLEAGWFTLVTLPIIKRKGMEFKALLVGNSQHRAGIQPTR